MIVYAAIDGISERLKMNIALIIAGGSGSRMNQKIPKQFLNVFDKPVIVYTMEAFQRSNEIDVIVISAVHGWETMIWAYANQFGSSKLKIVTDGGRCGQESIYNGITAIEKHYSPEDIVLVHDAIRPMLSEDIIFDCIHTVKDKGNAVAVIPCQEAMLETKDEQTTNASYPRNQLMRTQTPQGFYLKHLLSMHKEAKERGITNSVATCTLAVELGQTIYFSKGSEKNLKLTTVDDLDIFKALLKESTENWVIR